MPANFDLSARQRDGLDWAARALRWLRVAPHQPACARKSIVARPDACTCGLHELLVSAAASLEAWTSIATLRFDAATPSGNVVLRQHWRVRHKQQALWEALTLSAVRQASGLPGLVRAKTRRRLVVTRVGPRLLDPDNLVAGLKGTIVDPLRRRGVLVDDTPVWLDLPMPQQRTCRRGEAPHTIVEVLEAGVADDARREPA